MFGATDASFPGFGGIPWFGILFGLLLDPVVMPGENSGKANKGMGILVAF